MKNPWIQAVRPLAHVNIAIPLLLGQVAAWHVSGELSLSWLGAAVLWGVLDHMFIIFANDFADRDADTGTRTMISGGSGVLPEGKLSELQLERAAQASAAALLVYSCVLVFFGRPLTPYYALAALLLMWLYSFFPVRLSYRGGGEVLQGIGMGVGLPSLGFYLQTEAVFAPGWVIWPATLLGLCGNIVTALPDLDADRRANKRTWPVRHGKESARRFSSAGIAFAAFAVFLWTPSVSIEARAVVATAPLLPLLVGTRCTDSFRAAWWSSIALLVLMALWMLAMLLRL